jgi:hypothetical protein
MDMNKTEILVIARNERTLETAAGLINRREEWRAIPVSAAEEAIENFHRFNVDLVLLIHDGEDAEIKKMSKIFTHQNSGLALLQKDTVEDDELLCNEIEQLLEKRKDSGRSSFRIIDDALKGAELDIHVE